MKGKSFLAEKQMKRKLFLAGGQMKGETRPYPRPEQRHSVSAALVGRERIAMGATHRRGTQRAVLMGMGDLTMGEWLSSGEIHRGHVMLEP